MELTNECRRYSGVRWSFWPWTDQDVIRCTRFDLLNGNLVRSNYRYVQCELPEHLNQVERERVVVVNNEQTSVSGMRRSGQFKFQGFSDTPKSYAITRAVIAW